MMSLLSKRFSIAFALFVLCSVAHISAETGGDASFPPPPPFVPQCGHDYMLRSRSYKEEQQVIRANVTYGGKGRRATKSPIRIATNFQLTTLTQAEKDIVTNQLLPGAVAKLQELLYVNPVVGNLFVPRTCNSFWTSNGKCAQFASSNTCGGATIPSSHLGSEELCSSSPTSCTTLPGGTGIPNADFIIYVTDSGSCGGNVLAYAGHCSRDQGDRPIVGHTNVCKLLLTSSSPLSEKITTMVHEIVHALVFSSSHYAFYRYPDGSPRTPRGSNGNPTYDAATGSYVTSSNTLKTFSERGNTVRKIVLPRVVEELAIHSNCATINGLEIENAGGSGTAGSHWEGRVANQDFMTGSLKTNAAISTFTLALMEDSGWYYPDYSKAETLVWGLKQGCASVNQKCILNGVSASSEMFCTAAGDSCTADYKAYGSCAIYTYGSDLSPQYQYFTNPRQGGPEEADFCPYVSAYSNRRCEDSAQNSANAALTGQLFGTGSRCMSSSLLKTGYIYDGSVDPGCFKTACSIVGGVVQLSVTVDSVTKVCDTKGQTLTFTGYNGQVICPEPTVLCPDIGCTCPNGKCVDGVCRPSGAAA